MALNSEMTEKQEFLANLVLEYSLENPQILWMDDTQAQFASEEYILRDDAQEPFEYFAIWYDTRWDGTKESVKEFGLDPEHKVFEIL